MTFDQPLPPPPSRKLSIILISVWVVLCVAFLPLYLQTFHAYDIDFDAFYCGAHALLDGHNPYVQEPLRTCEAPLFFHDARSQAIIPAPLPGYAIAAFEPLAMLAPPAAKIAWGLILCVVVGFTISILRRVTHIGWIPIIVVVVASDVLISIPIGQLAPLCALGAVLIADALQRDRVWPIALGVALLCMQPQVALPVTASLLLFGSPRVRIFTLVTGIAVVAISLLAVGVNETLTLAFVAIPLQAKAELLNINQVSLASLLFQAGVPAMLALAGGTLSYVAFAAGGVVFAPRLSKRFDDRAFLVLLPAACAVCAGTYVHQQMYALAIPFGLLALRYMPLRWIAALLMVVAMPWEWVVATLYLYPTVTLSCALLATFWLSRSPIRIATIALLVCAASIFCALSYIHMAPARMPNFHYHIDPHALAQYTWIAVEQTYGGIGGSLGMTTARVVSVVSLGWLLIGSTLTAFPLPKAAKAATTPSDRGGTGIVKAVARVARHAMSSPALVRRAAFIAPFAGSVLSEIVCTASSLFSATFAARVANDADEPLFCSVFGETARGLDSLDPAEFRIEPRTKGSAEFTVRRRLFRPYHRVIVSMRNGALQYSIDARMPPLALGDRLRVAGSALIVGSILVFLYVCTHPALAFGALPIARTSATVAIPYRSDGIGQGTYDVTEGNNTISSGSLPNGDGTFSFTTAPQPQTYVLALHWSGPLATRDALVTLQSSVPPNAEPAPVIRALEVAKSTVASGDRVIVLYDASGTAGDITLRDTAQIAVAHAAFDRSGQAQLVAPAVDQPTPYRVQLHVSRGGAETNASVGVQIVPKPKSANTNEGDATSSGVGDVMRIDQAFVVGGQSLHVTLVEHQYPVHVALQDDSGGIVAERDVAASSDGTDFDIPSVSSERRFVVVITFSSGEGQQTMLIPVDVHPS